ncbi:MAG TPA: glycosyl hydrolase family 28-related protein [Puia sp.]|nr:glycosyl hydrolase family 28-related protein [Puia sp.]
MKFFSLNLILVMTAYSLSAQDTVRNEMTLSAFRKLRSPASLGRIFYLTDRGREGMFVRVENGGNAPDDSVMMLRTGDGVLFRRVADQGLLNVKWFGAMGNGSTDDWYAIQKGIDYILNLSSASRTLYFPPGNYKISRPLLIARPSGHTYLQSSIDLVGPANAKDLGMGAANIFPAFNNTFAIGIQSGKGVLIKDLSIRGRFTFPNRLRPVQIDTLSFDQWTDGATRDNQRSPYSGIVIDPFSDSTVYPSPSDMYPGLHAYYLTYLGRGASTAVQIIGCSIVNFIVGVMITPSNQQNGELIDVIDCDISDNKVGYAMGQAQSKECHVDRIKCWGGTHTLFDNVHYGFHHGDGAAVPLVDGVNIAGSVKELCCISARSFGGVFRNVYAEELFRIGYAGGGATLSFEDCLFNFATESPGKPYPDFFVLGSGASFHNCMLRCYTGKIGMRLVLSGSNDYYEDGTMNEPPVAVSLVDGIYEHPEFKNVYMYYSDGILGHSNTGKIPISPYFEGPSPQGRPDPLYPGNTYFLRDNSGAQAGAQVNYKLSYNDTYERTVQLSGKPVLHVNFASWTAWFRLGSPGDSALLKPGDFILTRDLPYQDIFIPINATTSPVGFIHHIGHDTVYLTNLAVGIREGMKLDLWMDYYVSVSNVFTGDMAVGSNVITQVQGAFPNIGDRPDIPMLPCGAYVTAVDRQARTIRFSAANGTGRSYSDYTFINGYPLVEIFSSFDPAALQAHGKTLIGGALLYKLDAGQLPTHERDLVPDGTMSVPYKIINTNIKGDTSIHKLRFISPPPASR